MKIKKRLFLEANWIEIGKRRNEWIKFEGGGGGEAAKAIVLLLEMKIRDEINHRIFYGFIEVRLLINYYLGVANFHLIST